MGTINLYLFFFFLLLSLLSSSSSSSSLSLSLSLLLPLSLSTLFHLLYSLLRKEKKNTLKNVFESFSVHFQYCFVHMSNSYTSVINYISGANAESAMEAKILHDEGMSALEDLYHNSKLSHALAEMMQLQKNLRRIPVVELDTPTH